MSKRSKTKNTNLDIPGLSLDDPLDINAKEPNFLNNQPYSAEFLELSKVWSNFPLYVNKEQMLNFFDSIHNNQVTLVISGTGSGKTVLIPKFLLKYFYITNNNKIDKLSDDEKKHHNSKIVVTNPKILTTIYNADYGARTLDVSLGSEVGYKFRGSPENMVSAKTKLLYSTDGLLLAQIFKGDILLSEYQGVIIDEAHERQVPIDLLLYFLKNVVKQRPEFKLIIMSATIDPKIFKDFYEHDNISFGQVEVSGQSNYPITSHYMKPGDKINFFNYMDVGLSIILKLLDETQTGDILMFVTSQRETEIGCNKLKTLCPNQIKISDSCDSYYCAEVYSKMPDDKRELAVSKDKYKNTGNFKRKIIFATNVAESSITLDGIVYVIDSGLELLSYFNYQKYCQVLEKRFITQAQVKQRMGRAGRTQPGECYHLYTEDKFNKLEKFPSPSIALVNMNEHFLSFMKYQKYLSEAIKLSKNLITPVTPYQLMSSIRYLHFYNLIKIVNLEQNAGKHKLSNKTLQSINYFLEGGDSESFIESESNSDNSDNNSDDMEYEKIENNLNNNHVNFKMLPYKSMNKYEDWTKYQGCLTRLGKIVHGLSGYPIELVMLAFYGRLLSISMIYPMVSIIIAMDYKLDNLIKFPNNLQNQDKIIFINENFPDAIPYFYSEHLFLYNLLTNYYEMGNKLELLNLPIFEKASEIKVIFSKVLDKIEDKYIDELNKKYKLIPEEINIDDLDMMEKVYLSLFLAFRYNTLRLVDNHTKPVYQTQYYIENTSNPITFQFGNQIGTEDANQYAWGICTQISNIMGKLYINGCTLIPNNYSNKFIQYYM
jgi:superfamily II DNA/RNA helicase